MRWDILALTSAAALWLAFQYWRDHERRRKLRSGFFGDCMNILHPLEITQQDMRFPTLRGRYKHFDVELEAFIDDMTVRKLPSLWLKVSLFAPVRYSGAFDLLVRPRGTEYYSPASDLPLEVKLPSGWPGDATIHSDDPARMPPVETVAQHLHLFDDAKMKELLIAPRGVRLIYQADQAERSQYSVLRQIEFGAMRLSPQLANSLLEAVSSVYQSVAVTPIEVSLHESGSVT